MDKLVELVVDESKWLAWSMGLAILAAATLLQRHRRSALAQERRVLAAMNLFLGVMIGTMAFGHLLAVTAKWWVGRLEGDVVTFCLIGVSLAVPSWWLIRQTGRILTPAAAHGRRTLALNATIAVVLLALGLHNLPLAVPAFLNIAYQLHRRRSVGWAILGVAVTANLVLFIGAMVFLASGQSFEQFRGME